VSLPELTDTTRTTRNGEIKRIKISHETYSTSIQGYEPKISPRGYVSWFNSPTVNYQRTGNKFLLRLPEERGAINIYNANTQAAPSTRLYTKGVALVIKSMKDAQDKVIAFHIQTTASERVTINVAAAYRIDSERVYTHLFANKELGFSGVERWRRHDVMRIISHRLAPLKESPTIITFLCKVVNILGQAHHVELPVASARACNEREVVGYFPTPPRILFRNTMDPETMAVTLRRRPPL
jgi:hypothetical protein